MNAKQSPQPSKGQMAMQTRRPLGAKSIFPPRRDFTSLSVKDLLDAREAYHVYLSQLDNVIATAIGRYCIHQDDWYAKNPPDRPRPADFPRVTAARTLANSIIRPWSWPAVLVFVRQWEQPHHLGNDVVPSNLYLPDGRIVPTCVIASPPDEELPGPSDGPFHASHLLGGGYACLREHQGEQALGTFACLVRTGGSYYALTNRHVAGGDSEVVKAYIRGTYEPIGKTSNIAVDRRPMSSIFPQWGERSTLLTLDAGLIKIDDINDWTSQAFGIGEIGEVFDATEYSVTLDLIGCPVRAFGGASGVIEGEVRAMFFRYEVQGGQEYATDVLIGPRRNQSAGGSRRPKVEHPFTRPGDSGTLWFYDPPSKPRPEDGNEDVGISKESPEAGVRARRLRPIAMQWGGQRVRTPDGARSAYALGSFVSSICRSLDVEVVRNWSLGHDEYWGKVGHFSIGWKACDQLSGDLGTLMKANQARIGFPDETIADGSGFRVGRDGFVPLADVPDYVWVHSARTSEPIQHFADIDIQDIDGGPSMLDRCVDDPADIAASKWKEYFDGFADKGVGPEDGVLPFRVWQIWDAMVAYLQEEDVLRFVAAAGVMAHYVGDASQPLHCSYLHHGVPPMRKVGGRNYPVPRDSDEFKEFKTSPEAKIHGIYEENMLEVDTASALAAVDEELRSRDAVKVDRSGHGAAKAVIALMSESQARLSPMAIIKADDPTQGPKARAVALWNNRKIQKATVESLADSVMVLAALWSSAWAEGKGARFSKDKKKIREYTEKELEPVYRKDRKFVPSLSLEDMVKSGKFEP